MNFEKKFNIGLTLETNLKEFEEFLKKYHNYIHSIFFSPPVSRYFHTRSKVYHMFLLPGKKKLFWKMLGMAKEYGIELELLLNTLVLNDDLIKKASSLLDEHDIKVDSVCFLTQYYQSVMNYFPNCKYILSFNNGFRSSKEIDQMIENYKFDTIVLGSSFIRNNKLFSYLDEKGKEVYLLLNNGCSFNCTTCNNVGTVCSSFFKQNLKTHSVEYLYALQSIFPFEIHDGIIDTSCVKCFKISNRSNNLKFVKEAIDSYINNEVSQYVKKNKDAYAYWGRAGYFWKHYKKMDLEKIYEHKRKLFNRKEELK